jgi:hypothetical protein
MSVGDIFWLFFMFTALQSMLQQRMMDAMRARKIAPFERKRGSRVILLVHRQETMRLLGFPLVRYIDINDSQEVLRAIQMTDDDVPPRHHPAYARRARACGAADRARDRLSQGQGHGLRAALRHVWRYADCARRQRNRHVQPRGPRPDRSAARPVPGCFAGEGGRAEADLRDRRRDADQGRRRARRLRSSSRPPASCSAAGFRPIRRRRWPRSSRPGPGRTTIRFEPPRPRNSAFPSAPTCRTKCSS